MVKGRMITLKEEERKEEQRRKRRRRRSTRRSEVEELEGEEGKRIPKKKRKEK